MAYTIMRFKKDKGGAVASCERHNERKKEAYKSNPDIDITKTKYNRTNMLDIITNSCCRNI